ncbi:PadR family transcriptional regulator [Cellulomonas chengniuliangii]|uniref:PadR family transcriptional regulator n=1 Tax=Cellulomonas chengniuliangii TaxID=2968084 RepID=UPI001D0E047D|nr:PadR family transcriptional regulator [Cellulomonas chengniuliangii]MCC2316873.1 PadR family transcriptional regulator [Cellulomonas chengniuliangii]
MPPVFAHGQLRLYLLALLEAGSAHGYELMRALSDRFGGVYRPSPGTIYPRLARLEEEGLVRRSDDGRKGTYSLTSAGREELERRRGELASLEEDLSRTVRDLAAQVRDEVRRSMTGLRAELAAAAQQARAGSVPDADAPSARDDSYARRLEVEALVQRFRDEVRADLRQADARAGVGTLTVETVRTVLDGALAAVRSTLR